MFAFLLLWFSRRTQEVCRLLGSVYHLLTHVFFNFINIFCHQMSSLLSFPSVVQHHRWNKWILNNILPTFPADFGSEGNESDLFLSIETLFNDFPSITE